MSEETEIEFETVDSPRWPEVKEGARRSGERSSPDPIRRCDLRSSVVPGRCRRPCQGRHHEAAGQLPGFGAIAEAVMAACVLLLPEATLAAEIAEAVKTAYEMVKPAAELVEKANQEVVANSVEEARNYLQELTKTYAEDVADKALPVKQAAQNAVGAALELWTSHRIAAAQARRRRILQEPLRRDRH